MRAGQIEAVFAGDAVGKYYEKQGQFTTAVTGLFPGTPAAFATADAKLGDAVAAALSAMVADGTYGRMMEFHGATPIDKWTAYPGKIQAFHTP